MSQRQRRQRRQRVSSGWLDPDFNAVLAVLFERLAIQRGQEVTAQAAKAAGAQEGVQKTPPPSTK